MLKLAQIYLNIYSVLKFYWKKFSKASEAASRRRLQSQKKEVTIATGMVFVGQTRLL